MAQNVLPTKLRPKIWQKSVFASYAENDNHSQISRSSSYDQSKLNPNNGRLLCGWWSKRHCARFPLTTFSSHYFLWHRAACENQLGVCLSRLCTRLASFLSAFCCYKHYPHITSYICLSSHPLHTRLIWVQILCACINGFLSCLLTSSVRVCNLTSLLVWYV